MFRLLAEHPGPDISAAAAVSLAGIPAASSRQAIAELTNSQLVDEPAAGRFAFHDLLRLYAAELPQAIDSPADRRAAGQRVLDHYLHTARAAAQAINPIRKLLDVGSPAPGTTPEAICGEEEATAWLTAERVMMRAIGYAASAGFDAYGWQLSWALTDFLYRSGHWLDWADSQRTALAAATRLGDVAAQAQACAELGHKMAEGHTWDSLGYIHHRIGQPEQALACYRKAVDILHQLGDLYDESRALTHLGDALHETGDLAAARRAWQDALVILDDLDHPECDQLRVKIGQASLGSA